jgi:hypothetical protein
MSLCLSTKKKAEKDISKEPNNYQYEKGIITSGYMYFSRLQQCE